MNKKGLVKVIEKKIYFIEVFRGDTVGYYAGFINGRARAMRLFDDSIITFDSHMTREFEEHYCKVRDFIREKYQDFDLRIGEKTIMIEEKKEVEEMAKEIEEITEVVEAETVINTEVKKVNHILEHDYEEAYNELQHSWTLSDYADGSSDVKRLYNERVESVNEFIGQWSFESSNNEQYSNFISKLQEDYQRRYANTEINIDDYRDYMQFISSINIKEFEENKKDGVKLGKLLKKKGFSQSAIDYYSALDRKKERLYLTITDAPQAIIGMSNHGKGWSSCQDTKSDNPSYVSHVLGAMADTSLLIMVLTKEPLKDWSADMEDIILARSSCHVFNYQDKNVLVPNGVYSSSHHDGLKDGCKALQSIGMRVLVPQSSGTIMLRAVTKTFNLYSEACFYAEVSEEVEVSCECPLCYGQGVVEASTRNDAEVRIDCPLCDGSGEYETTICIEETFEEYEDIEDYIGAYEDNSLSYSERYKTMRVNEDELFRVLEIGSA